MNQPNILFITCDQLRWDALGCYNNPHIQTPNIDAIASTGVKFENMFAAYPVCAPNRASIATGRYPSVHGVTLNGKPLPLSETTLMEVLRQNGYATYGVGKMHFGPQWSFPPQGGPLIDPDPAWAINPQPRKDEFPWYGFTKAQITEDHRVGPYGEYLASKGYDVWEDLHSFSYPQHATVRSVYPEEHHQTTWIGERSMDYLREHDCETPFFMWTSFVDPHHPFTPPAPYDTMYDPADMPLPDFSEDEVERWPEHYRQAYFATQGSHVAVGMCNQTDDDWRRIKAYYYGSISLIDKQVGRIVDTLRSLDMLGNTIIVFTSDHGEMLGDHHLVFKGTMFDEVTRVPMLVRPAGGCGQTVVDGLCSSIDIMPTLLEMAGVTSPPSVQGRSLVPAEEYSESDVPEILIEDYAARTILTKNARLTWFEVQQRGELYDMQTDPLCQRNLWDLLEHAQFQQEMMNRLIGLMSANVDPLPVQTGAC